MSDAISKAIEAMDMARNAVGPFAVVVTRKLTESIEALQALQSGEPVAPEGWNISAEPESIRCKAGIRIDAPNDAHAILVRDSRLPQHHIINMFYDLSLALLSAGKENAPSHQWDADGERCVKCGDKDWCASVVCDESKLRMRSGK
jgi:hypothetical protein